MERKLGIVVACWLVLGCVAGPPARAADPAHLRVALSNSYAGNSWRQSMLRSWATAAEAAKADGLGVEAAARTTDENLAWQQAAHIREMIRDHYDAIVINAASPTALNDAVSEACAAGIVVVSFDNIVSEPCAYRIAVDFAKLGTMQINYFRTRGLRGNLLEVRGIPGSSVNDAIHAGVEAELRAGSDLTIVASVHGDWTDSIAKRAVASLVPHLPDVVAVTTQGGDGVGVAQAFTDAGRSPPVIFLGNRQNELAWWKQQHDATGYETMSASIAPGCASFAFWFTYGVLTGQKTPKDVTLPLTIVTQDELADALSHTEGNGVYSRDYSRQDVAAILAKNSH